MMAKSYEHTSTSTQSSDELSLDPVLIDLKDYKGALQGKTHIQQIKRLREMMKNDAAETGEWLTSIVTLSEWHPRELVKFLTDKEVKQRPEDDSSSLLRNALANIDYLRILLQLDDAVTASLIKDLFYIQDKSGKTGMQQLVENRDFKSLTLIFTAVRRHPGLLTTVPALASSFKDTNLDDLLAFAAAKGAVRHGPAFHELVGDARLLDLSESDILRLIETLLTEDANSDGVALYIWYAAEKSVSDPSFHQQFRTLQRKKAGENLPLDVMQACVRGRDLLNDPIANSLIHHVNRVELSLLVNTMFNTWGPSGKTLIPTILSIRRADVEYLLNQGSIKLHPGYDEKLCIKDHKEVAAWLQLFVLNSDKHIPLVLQYIRQNNSTVYPYVFHNLCQLLDDYPEKVDAIVKQLKPDETFSLINSAESLPHFSKKISLGILSFSVMRNFLYRDMSRLEFRNDALPQSDYKSGDFSLLAKDLLRYRSNRNRYREQRFSFWGIEAGFSKDEKFAVVDKIFTFLYGTQQEKETAGVFTARDKLVMEQGDLGKCMARYPALTQEIVDLADRVSGHSHPLHARRG